MGAVANRVASGLVGAAGAKDTHKVTQQKIHEQQKRPAAIRIQ